MSPDVWMMVPSSHGKNTVSRRAQTPLAWDDKPEARGVMERQALVQQYPPILQLDMFRNFAKNSFKSDVALKHAQDEVPARKAPQKIRNRRP